MFAQVSYVEFQVVDWNQNSRPPIVTAEDRLRDSVKSRHSQMYQNMDSVYMDVNKLKSDIIRRSRRPEGEGPVYANEWENEFATVEFINQKKTVT